MELEDDWLDGEHMEQSPAVGNPTISTPGSNVAAASTTTSRLERGQTPPGLLHPHVASMDHTGCNPSFGGHMVRTGPVPPSPPVGLLPSIAVPPSPGVGWLPSIVVYRPPLSEIRPYPGVLTFPPPAGPPLPSVACQPPLSETSPGPPFVPCDRFFYIDMEAFVGQDVPLHGYNERYRMDAGRHDRAFVGGSHETGGTPNASILREHSTSVAAAQRRRHADDDDGGEQELAERRERSRHHDHRRERDRYGRHDHDRHMTSSTISHISEERDHRYSYDHDHDSELGRDRYVPYRSRHTRDNYRHERDQRYAYDRRDRCRAELRRDRYVPCLSRYRENRGRTDRSERDQRHASRDGRRRDRHTDLGRERSYIPRSSRRIRDRNRDERAHRYDHGRDRNSKEGRGEIRKRYREDTYSSRDVDVSRGDRHREEITGGSSNNQDEIGRHRGRRSPSRDQSGESWTSQEEEEERHRSRG